ncbi:MAG: virulence protein [Candidatus Yanofskybacteria bacterium]|nr:virulence protein [Candidatus Yanofskybacteria bacterium]
MKKEGSKKGEIIIYKTSTGPKLEVRLEKETIWMTQAQIAALFGSERTVITKHLNNVFKEGELHEKSNVQKMHIPNSDKFVKFYDLDAIISVGSYYG